jgi:hypothetical protein
MPGGKTEASRITASRSSKRQAGGRASRLGEVDLGDGVDVEAATLGSIGLGFDLLCGFSTVGVIARLSCQHPSGD